ncbi:MAG: fibronectin type III domain-containing protein, partial [Treponema sp.]|nr:fibronectin type III domain-containing protein [Treponema sp.]
SLKAGKKKVSLKWKKVKGVKGYTVYCKKSKKGKWKKLKTVSAKKTSYIKKKLKSGKSYYFTVKAYKVINGKKVYGKFTTKKVKVK